MHSHTNSMPSVQSHILPTPTGAATAITQTQANGGSK